MMSDESLIATGRRVHHGRDETPFRGEPGPCKVDFIHPHPQVFVGKFEGFGQFRNLFAIRFRLSAFPVGNSSTTYIEIGIPHLPRKLSTRHAVLHAGFQ